MITTKVCVRCREHWDYDTIVCMKCGFVLFLLIPGGGTDGVSGEAG